MTRPADPPQLEIAPWMCDDAAKLVFSALENVGGTARFVGGCVRNHIRDLPARDFDIATDLKPPDVISAAKAIGLRAIPTGLGHGTVTVLAAGRSFEITTLRRDVETDGRHAVVAFSQDWAEDAARRDFTMNAIFMSPDGVLLDPMAGYEDAKSGYVRFVGNAETRIREDYLRILRFFRFHAQFGLSEIDGGGLAACEHLSAGIGTLSGERVRSEVLRLLETENPVATLKIMHEKGILARIDKDLRNIETLTNLIEIETKIDPVLRLSALLAGDGQRAVKKLRFSKSDEIRLTDLINEIVGFPKDEAALKYRLYTHGRDVFLDHLLVEQARGEVTLEQADFAAQLAASWSPPSFPLFGRDLLDAGLTPGVEVGAMLSRIEDWWIEDGYRADKEQCLRQFNL